MAPNASRLPAVRSLSSILPDGAEGGNEFARVVGLLLFQDARRQGREFNLFDDASGDYEGLDSFSRLPRRNPAIGYQYKFFTSPLSDKHRSEIRAAVVRAAERSKALKLEKYVVVTPDDLKNSAKRSGGGDVTWFEKLREEYQKHFELEHIGHSKIQSLFLQAPHLCLYYYPELMPSGAAKRKTINEVRTLYDAGLKARYGRIEFVGMSVYKEEASRRIPLENIYIPLSVVPERAPEETEDTPRANPASFLSLGTRTVILGDPGSGKSTLMAFLALVGISEPLQKRCSILADDRLTVMVTLRRYADELKQRTNLSLLDYMLEVTRADFSIDAMSKEFLEFYLESGRTILLFDGLDELPGSQYKAVVRKRIESYNDTYPGNTVIITSRIVGYEAEVRFDDSYAHFRVAKLKTPEIERFIIDWYAARIDDQIVRDKNASDLVRVITATDNEAIRDLARNPLLLTIVALVHRIDAVLPDQRVVLYQKCTETLLNTWHKAKKRDEELAKGRIERRNRLRIEAIAYWMHRRSLGESGRAVAPHAEVLSFLTDYIQNNETSTSGVDPAEDQAELFLDFIRSGAGLLIEAGDGLYSFIHLTFQEYLSATHLTSNGEIGGAATIWDELGGDLDNPRWREVVRLLVASLRSTMGQRFFIKKLLESAEKKVSRDSALLLLGLLRDGIEPAEEDAFLIVTHALQASIRFVNVEDLRSLNAALKAWIDKAASNSAVIEAAMLAMKKRLATTELLALALARIALGLPSWSRDELFASCDDGITSGMGYIYSSLISNETGLDGVCLDWRATGAVYDLWATQNPDGNVAAAAGLGISILLDGSEVPTRLLSRELIMIGTAGYGPHRDHLMNLLAIALPSVDLPEPVIKALHRAFKDRGQTKIGGVIDSMFVGGSDRLNKRRLRMTGYIREALRAKIKGDAKLTRLAQRRVRHLDGQLHSRELTLKLHSRELTLIRESFATKMVADPSSYWRMTLGSEVYEHFIFPSILTFTDLIPEAHWQVGLRTALETQVPVALASYLDRETWARLEQRLLAGSRQTSDLDFAAWLMLLDAWTLEHDGYSDPDESPMHSLTKIVKGISYAPLEFATCIRGICLGDHASEKRLRELTAQQDLPTVKLLHELGWPRPSGRSLKTARRKPAELRETNPN